MSRYLRANPHKILTRLVAANIGFDIIAVAFWTAFPATQWSIYRLGFSIVGTEAVFAAALFALTLFGLVRRRRWAPFLAIAITVTQRVFSNYAFFPEPANILVQPLILTPNAATLTWSLIIIYFAYKDKKNSKRAHLTVISIINRIVVHPNFTIDHLRKLSILLIQNCVFLSQAVLQRQESAELSSKNQSRARKHDKSVSKLRLKHKRQDKLQP